MSELQLKKGFVLKKEKGEWFLCSESGKPYCVLNDSGCFLFGLLKERNMTKAEMLEELLANREISTVLALGDIDTFVRLMKQYEIIQE